VRDGGVWTRIRLPAVSEGAGDPLDRPEGAPLWPGRFSGERLAQIRVEVGPRVWNALYQQRPSPDEGEVFLRSWWRHYDDPPSRRPDQVIASWDMSFKDEASSDYVVGQVWHRYGADCYLVDQRRARLAFPATRKAVVALAEQHAARGYPPRVVLVEESANGPAIIQSLTGEVPGIIGVKPKGSKISRANGVSGTVEAGQVHLPNPAHNPWVEDFVEESAAFPLGANDDQVDAMTQALERLRARAAHATITIATGRILSRSRTSGA
jgi:predicted phage terminase large subunit-like protein